MRGADRGVRRARPQDRGGRRGGHPVLARVVVTGARDDTDAERAARTVATSPLVKTAVAGHDANWGRIAAALGRSGAQGSTSATSTSTSWGIPACRDGLVVDFDEDEALRRFEFPRSTLCATWARREGDGRPSGNLRPHPRLHFHQRRLQELAMVVSCGNLQSERVGQAAEQARVLDPGASLGAKPWPAPPWSSSTEGPPWWRRGAARLSHGGHHAHEARGREPHHRARGRQATPRPSWQALGMPVEFEDGLRVTTPEVMRVVSMGLSGKVNEELVLALNASRPVGSGAFGGRRLDGPLLHPRP